MVQNHNVPQYHNVLKHLNVAQYQNVPKYHNVTECITVQTAEAQRPPLPIVSYWSHRQSSAPELQNDKKLQGANIWTQIPPPYKVFINV